MRIKDIITESSTDVVARYYKEASKSSDKFYNPEIAKYKEKNDLYYKEYFEEWFKNESVPLFTKPVTQPQPEYTNKPKDGKLQSPGYRGLQYSKAAAGLPYDKNVQPYKVNPAMILAKQTMDGARNNNGQ